MSYSFLIPLLFVLYLALPLRVTLAQTCVSSQVIFSDLTSINSAYTSQISLSGNANVDSSDTSLTTTAADSFGGFFFASPTDFTGPGGFSVKFAIQSTDTSAGPGDVWEFIVAGSSNLDIVSPPYSAGSGNEGLSGWSRRNAFVVEFDSLNSGTGEQDESTNHVAIYLAGDEQCKTDVAFSFASGDKYTVWVDYSGFASKAEVRVGGANDDTRPTSATLSCDVDIWSTMDISTANHVGFMAYNPSTGGAEHSLVDSLSVADSYNPYDFDSCSVYGSCSQKNVDALCLTPQTSSTCLLADCSAGYIWDLSGTDCCAFVEKATWALSDSAGSGPFSAGDTVACEQVQRTIAFLTTPDQCASNTGSITV